VSKNSEVTPPVAEKRAHEVSHHGRTISDPYAWLRDPNYPEITDPQVLDHLKAENAFFEAQMGGRKPLIDALFAEMRARIKEADSSVPQKDGDWVYWSEYEEGGEYARYWRRPAAGGEAQCYLDGPKLAEGHDYFSLNDVSVSENGRLLAYSVDTNGSERYTAYVVDLATGEKLGDEIPDTNTSLVWAADDTMLLYGRANAQWRVDSILVHVLGTDAASDREIYHEDRLGFTAGVGLSGKRDWLIVSAGDHATSEVRLLPASDPLAEAILVKPAREEVEYGVDVHGETIYIWTNDAHINFRLAKAPLSDPGNWSEVIPGSDDFYLTGFDLYEDFFVTEGRLAGLDQIAIHSYDAPLEGKPITFPEATYSASLVGNPEWDVDTIRLTYSSMVAPHTVYDYHLASGELETRKVQEIPSGYDASLYTSERLMIPARDGTEIPVSVVYRKDRPQGGPLHLYGYGAYGIAIDPSFSTTRLSLVDRGFAYAIAHIRGGDDLGRAWYNAGKREQRTNTFNDFEDVARGLIALGYTAPGKISSSGGSAGGELMGAVVNQAPELFGAVVAHVPFVDVLNTMLDETLPLTPGEWPEWGNPVEDVAAFDLIASYSPYDQVRAQGYPPLMVTAGLNDPRVTYWEPAKWVARLRELKTDDNVLVFKTNMGAGHAGKTGRFEGLKEVAEEVAFILWQLGLAE
tara:strand:- start:14029 stop:16092 length:2064 start_codon:yes stop_codon:yes gene_type:complete